MPIKIIEDPCFGKGTKCYEKQEWIFWKNYQAEQRTLKDLQKEKELFENEKKFKQKLKRPFVL